MDAFSARIGDIINTNNSWNNLNVLIILKEIFVLQAINIWSLETRTKLPKILVNGFEIQYLMAYRTPLPFTFKITVL